MVKLMVLCGVQASGKSTLSKKLKEEFNAEIVSSDAIRLEHNFEYSCETSALTFKILYERINELLAQGKNVIMDATNITIKARKVIFDNVKVKCHKSIYILNTPIEVCKERLKARNESDHPQKIDLSAIDKYVRMFQVPFYEEGWDHIEIVNTPTYEHTDKFILKMLDACKGFNQHNKHHTDTLDQHIDHTLSTLDELMKNNPISCERYVIGFAALLHDIGKLYTQTFSEDGNAHYYAHESVGAYEVICNTFFPTLLVLPRTFKELVRVQLDVVFYINYHMHMNSIKTEKAEKKWKRLFGEQKFNDLKIFNKADRSRKEAEDVCQ